MTIKEDYAILTDGRLDERDVGAVRRMAATVPLLVGMVISLVLSAASILGFELPAAPGESATPVEADTDTDTE